MQMFPEHLRESRIPIVVLAVDLLTTLRRAERSFQRSLCLPDLVQVSVRSTEIRPRLFIVAKHIRHELDSL